MNNSSIVIIQSEYQILQSLTSLAAHIKEQSSFFELYNADIISLISMPRFITEFDKFISLIEDGRFIVQMVTLNTFAKSRLINNFEDKWPELALRVMSCGKESKIIKIKRKFPNEPL